MKKIIASILLATTFMGCASTGGQALKNCELGKLPAEEQAAIVAVTSALSMPGEWQTVLESLAGQLGADQVSCIITAIVAATHPAASRSPRESLMYERAQWYLHGHPSKACRK